MSDDPRSGGGGSQEACAQFEVGCPPRLEEDGAHNILVSLHSKPDHAVGGFIIMGGKSSCKSWVETVLCICYASTRLHIQSDRRLR